MDEAALAITAIARGVSPLGRDAFSFFSAENNNENHAQHCTFAAVYKYHRYQLHFLSFQQQLLNYSNLNYCATMLLLVYTVTVQYNTTLLSLCREFCFLARHLHKNIAVCFRITSHWAIFYQKVEAGSITCTLSLVCFEYKMMGQAPTNLHMLTQNALKKIWIWKDWLMTVIDQPLNIFIQ